MARQRFYSQTTALRGLQFRGTGSSDKGTVPRALQNFFAKFLRAPRVQNMQRQVWCGCLNISCLLGSSGDQLMILPRPGYCIMTRQDPARLGPHLQLGWGGEKLWDDGRDRLDHLLDTALPAVSLHVVWRCAGDCASPLGYWE